jgi:Uma2 family endonuclease
MASLPHPRFTIEEYLELEHKLGTKHEYHQGQVFAMSGGSPAHSIIQVNLAASIAPRLEGSSCVAHSADLRILVQASGLYTYPDFSIICGPLGLVGGMTATNPKVIFEVLSPSTRRYDCIGKFAHYRQIPSLEEYVLVEQDSYGIDRHRKLPDGQWELTRFEGADAELELASVNISVPLRQIYAHVPFELAEQP